MKRSLSAGSTRCKALGDAVRLLRFPGIASPVLGHSVAYRMVQISGSTKRCRCLMTLTFSCPGCGKQLKLGEELAGKNIKCLGCQAEGQVPAAPEAAALSYALADNRAAKVPSLAEQGLVRGKKKRSSVWPGTTKMLVLLGAVLVLPPCCATCGVGGWWYFFNFQGSELVGTWETESSAKDHYAQVRFSRFGHITIVAPGLPVGVTGNWRVLSKTGSTYTIDVYDEYGQINITITMLSDHRILLVVPRSMPVELRRMK
jgi:hypothetical protein